MSDDRAATDTIEIARLSALPPIERDRQLRESAKRLGCLASTLRRQVEAVRGDAAGNVAGQGRPLDLPEPEPWPEPVDGAALLDALAIAVRRYVVLSKDDAHSVALWVLAVHAFDAWRIFPRLLITAPEKGCGKTTLLDVLKPLVPRPLAAANIKAAPLFRVIELAHPTLLLDEADAYACNDEDLRSVIDAGHHQEGAVIRCVGDEHEPRQFSAWAPVVLAAIGHLPGTIEDRSIRITLRRRRPDEPIEPLRLDRVGGLEQLARMAARWGADHAAELAEADPTMPAGIINRTADNWRPLLAVADLAGGIWPECARRAAAELSADTEDSASMTVMLLADLQELFKAQPSGVLFTKEILAALHKDETRPWPEWKNGKPLTDRQLAALLKAYKIKPRTVRRATETDKGYHREWFDDVFARYVPPQSGTASQASNPAGFDDTRSVTQPPNVTDGMPERASVSAACDAVTLRERHPDGDEFLERAGIREFDGGYPRAEAERLARAEISLPHGNA